MRQRSRLFARTRETIRICRKRNDDKRFRAARLDMLRGFRKPFDAGHCFKKEARQALVQEVFRHGDITRARILRFHRRRADIGKHDGVVGFARPLRQPAGRLNQLALLALVLAGQRHVRGKRIRLNCPTACRQIPAMQC